MPPEIRVLTPGDHALLRRMLALFGKVFAAPDTYTGRQPDDGYLQGLLARDTFVAVAALAGKEIVGGLAAYVLPKFDRARARVSTR